VVEVWKKRSRTRTHAGKKNRVRPEPAVGIDQQTATLPRKTERVFEGRAGTTAATRARRAGSALRERVDQVENFPVVADVTPRLELGVDESPVDLDVEDPVVAGDLRDLRAELLLDGFRQTGGDGVVVSDVAERDLDRHLASSRLGRFRPGICRGRAFGKRPKIPLRAVTASA